MTWSPGKYLKSEHFNSPFFKTKALCSKSEVAWRIENILFKLNSWHSSTRGKNRGYRCLSMKHRYIFILTWEKKKTVWRDLIFFWRYLTWLQSYLGQKFQCPVGGLARYPLLWIDSKVGHICSCPCEKHSNWLVPDLSHATSTIIRNNYQSFHKILILFNSKNCSVRENTQYFMEKNEKW